MDIPGNTSLSDERYAEQMQRLDRLMQRWKALLGFDAWDIECAWSRTPIDQNRDGGVTVMKCSCDWRYMRGMISADVEEIAPLSDAALELKVIHELLHIALHETRPLNDGECRNDWLDHEEHAATFLAKAFLRVAKDGAQKVQQADEAEPQGGNSQEGQDGAEKAA